MPSLEVIGAGFGRTGTYSLYLALNKLGYKTMHGFTIGRDATLDVTVWENAKDHPGTDWNKVYGGVNGVNAAVDHPTCDFAIELSEFYPDAKVILTVRSPESWLKSMRKTIGYSYSTIEMPQSHLGDVGRMLQKTTYFGMIGFDCAFEDDNYMCEYFTRHNQRIIDSIPSDRLLIMNLGDGWEPLCKFLGKPIPDEPYPMTNSSDEFVEHLAEYLRNGQQACTCPDPGQCNL
ncbi:P-loop containing nucleoside triphosphate hydrolase protein [Gongronella butleri]|nr:P-loop containing nucleoside triphosphate hydrolase protein [Gongronella butleri]